MINQISLSELKHDISGMKNGSIPVVPPISAWYVQFTSSGTFLSAEEPATLFGGGTWSQVFAGTNGEFFKQSGSSGGQTRTAGLQPDQFQGHWHQSYYSAGAGTDGLANTNAITGSGVIVRNPVTDGTNGTPRTGSVTEPTNREIKVWKRTA